MKNSTSPNEQVNEAEEGSHSLESNQRIRPISIISVIYTLATAAAATTTPALCLQLDIDAQVLLCCSLLIASATPMLRPCVLLTPSRETCRSRNPHKAGKCAPFCPADNPLRWETGLLLQMSSPSEMLGREVPVRTGLQGEHPVHCRVSAATAQGRILCTVFYRHSNQSRMRTHPSYVPSSALSTAHQATTELVQNVCVDTVLHSHLLCGTHSAISLQKHHLSSQFPQLPQFAQASDAASLLPSQKTLSCCLAAIAHPACTEPSSALLAQAVPPTQSPYRVPILQRGQHEAAIAQVLRQRLVVETFVVLLIPQGEGLRQHIHLSSNVGLEPVCLAPLPPALTPLAYGLQQLGTNKVPSLLLTA